MGIIKELCLESQEISEQDQLYCVHIRCYPETSLILVIKSELWKL